jgi:hypothetical protein
MSASDPKLPRVFISYSQDSQEHIDRVVDLSDRLCAEGVDCHLDQYEASPPEGWSRWAENQIRTAEFVLAVCTEKYGLRFRGLDEKGEGLGVKAEAAAIDREIYRNDSNNNKFIPIVFGIENATHLPPLLRNYTCYDVSTEEGYKNLYRRLTNQPKIIKPDLGKLQPLLPLKRMNGANEYTASSRRNQPSADHLALPVANQPLEQGAKRWSGRLTGQRAFRVAGVLFLCLLGSGSFWWPKLYAAIYKTSVKDAEGELLPDGVNKWPDGQLGGLLPGHTPPTGEPTGDPLKPGPSRKDPPASPPGKAGNPSKAELRQFSFEKVQGKVVDFDNPRQPLANVKVSSGASGEKAEFVTDPEGWFEFRTQQKPGERVWIWAKKEAYMPNKQFYTVGTGPTVITLRRN